MGGGNIALAQVFEDHFAGPMERIAEAAAAGPLDANRIVASKPVIAETRWQRLFGFCFGIDQAGASTPRHAVVAAEGCDRMLVGAHGEADIVGEDSILADKAQAAAPLARAAGVGKHLEALDAG